MIDFITRVKTIAKSVLAWLTIIAAIATGVAQQLKDVEGIPAPVLHWVVTIAAVLTIVVFQVRQHTPVDISQRGLLPPKGPATPSLDANAEVHVPNQGLALIEFLVGGAILIVLAYLLFRVI